MTSRAGKDAKAGNIRGKMIKAAFNLYVSVLKWIDYFSFEINQYVITAERLIIYKDYLRVGITVQIVFCKYFRFYLAKMGTHKEKLSRQARHV